MGQFDIYGQVSGHGVSIGYDQSEGVTISFFVQGSMFVSGASSWSFNLNWSLSDPITVEGTTDYFGAGTPAGLVVQGTKMQNLSNGDTFSSVGVGVADFYEVGFAWERQTNLNPIQTIDFWNDQIAELSGLDTPEAVKLEILQDLIMARQYPAWRDDIAERYGLVQIVNQEPIGQSEALSIQPGQTRTVQTESGAETFNVMQTIDTPSGEQQVWVGSSYLGGGTSGSNSAPTTGHTTTGQQSSGSHHNDPDNSAVTGHSNSSNDHSGDNIFGGSGVRGAASSGAGSAGGSIPQTDHHNDPDSGTHTTTVVQTTHVVVTDHHNDPDYDAHQNDVVEDRRPILLDLDGNGIRVTELDRSTVFMDASGSGLKHRTAWAGAGDGVLFYDADGSNTINDDHEYVFTEWDKTAGDDLTALRSRFDTNGDGKLSGTELNKFKVMVTGANGALTVQTLAALGITELRLTPDTTRVVLADGSAITGQATFVQGGQSRTLADTTLATHSYGQQPRIFSIEVS